MSQTTDPEEGRIYRGDVVKQVRTDYETEAHEDTAEAILEYWGQGYSHDEIADEVGWSSSTVRHVMNNYFEAVERGQGAENQRVVDTDATGAGGGEETDEGEMDSVPITDVTPDDETTGDEVDGRRVAQIADWYGVTKDQAEIMARAEEATGIELSGREGLEGETGGPGPMETSEEVLDVYRRGFTDGFDAALDHLKELREVMVR